MASVEIEKSALEALVKWLELWSAIFGVIVVIGVAGESFFGIRLLWNNWKLQRLQAGESERLRLDVATANARAAEANQRAAETEARLAPRKLSAEQQNSIAAKLTAFHGTRVGVFWSKQGEPEVVSLALDIVTALRLANWETKFALKTDRVPLGVLIELTSEDRQTETTANALAAALKHEGIFTNLEAFTGLCTDKDEPIHVIVGSKPDWVFP